MQITTTPDIAGPVAFDSRQSWRVFAALLFGTFITIEAAAFQSPALASITSYFGIPVSMAGIMTLVYYLGAAVFAPAMGALGDGIGRKRMIMIGLTLFALSEFLAAASPNIVFLIAMRFLQGIAVACILPVVLATISYLFPVDRRGLPLGVMALAMGLGATTGAVLAGLLIDRFGWRSIYVISGVLAVLGLMLTATAVPAALETEVRTRRSDVRGTFLLLLTLGGLLSLPTLIGIFGFSVWTLLPLFIGGINAVVLWRSSTGNPAAVIDTALLKKREFILPCLIYLLLLLTYAGVIYCFAFILADRPGGSAADVGIVNMFMYGASALGAPLAGRLVDRVDARYVMMGALILMLLGLLAIAQIKADTSLLVITVIISLIGFITGSKTPAIMKIALSAVPLNVMGRGSGLLTLMRDIGAPAGATFSLAIYSATVGQRTREEIMNRTAAVDMGQQWAPALEKLITSRGRVVDSALQGELTARGLDVSNLIHSATAAAINDALPMVAYALAGVILVAIALAALVLRGPSKRAA